MSQPPFDEQSRSQPPWAHVWPYNQQQSVNVTHHPKQNLHGLMDRHNCQSIFLGNMTATRPTFSQIFIMAHTSRPNFGEDDVSSYPVITTHHRLPKRKFISQYDSKGQTPGPPWLLPQRRKFSIQIPVIREDLTESPLCSPTVDTKHGDQDGSTSPHDYHNRRQFPVENPNVQADKMSPCTPSVGDGQVKPNSSIALPAQNNFAGMLFGSEQ